MFTYKAMRYECPIEDQFATIEEAIKRARSDNERDEAWPVEIVDVTGKPVVDEGSMNDLLDRSI